MDAQGRVAAVTEAARDGKQCAIGAHCRAQRLEAGKRYILNPYFLNQRC